jgi:L-lactate dehydrogenase complex protein LldE
MVKNNYPNLKFENQYDELSKTLSKKVFEFSEFFVKILKCTDFESKFIGKATYHDSCHLLRELNVKDEPRILMKNVKGLELVESENHNKCCGFGGTFSVKYAGLSDSMGDDKADGIIKTDADFVIAGDDSCLMQIKDALQKRKSKIKTIHLAEVLAEGL